MDHPSGTDGLKDGLNEREHEIAQIILEGIEAVGWEDEEERAVEVACVLARKILELPYPPDQIPIPQNEEQAAGMCIGGEQWLRDHAPHRLRKDLPPNWVKEVKETILKKGQNPEEHRGQGGVWLPGGACECHVCKEERRNKILLIPPG